MAVGRATKLGGGVLNIHKNSAPPPENLLAVQSFLSLGVGVVSVMLVMKLTFACCELFSSSVYGQKEVTS